MRWGHIGTSKRAIRAMSIKLDLPLIAAIVAFFLLFETSHQTAVEAQSSVASTTVASPCADYDARYTANRLIFISGGYVSGIDRRQIDTDRAALPPDCAP